MNGTIPPDGWQEIDAAIVADQKLSAIQQIRQQCGCSLREGLQLLAERYARLRKESPERFGCSDQEYWSGFYS